ncbi:hypothetical protein H0H81_001195 [Sphagnurus paluster]|uniref:Uncharacterized protein n=1 Tax=Sphagnurus paluster TaxID=117069 RepID=A0A9P7GME5_9AGAR|nr:hypothetical protein H0H81_001195 [Sphagnurus paluster]
MAPRPLSWVKDYEEVDIDPSLSPAHSVSGLDSPHERQRMLADEPSPRMPPAVLVDSAPTPSSSTHAPRTPHTSNSRPTSSNMPQYPSPESSTERPQSMGSDAGPSYRLPRAASYRSVTSSPLNPAFPSGPPSSHIFSPFARPGSRGSAHITRIPSEETRALAPTSPFALNTASSRGSMILYRRVDAADDVLLPPTLPHANRNSTISTSGDSAVSLSSDSKYPAGMMMTPERGLIAYAWDPTIDDNEPADEEDILHDPDEKLVKVPGRPLSWRGFKNISALVFLVVGLLCLFVVYPVVAFVHSSDRNALIVGNTRINATGQAVSYEFDPRSQLPLPSVLGVIDQATPQEALSQTGKDGVEYHLVFSDEFNTDGRSFSRDADPVWETESSQVTTRNGYLVLQSYTASADGSSRPQFVGESIRQKSSLCIDGGFVEISAVMPWSHQTRRLYWTGAWSDTIDDISFPEQGSSLSVPSSVQLTLGGVDPSQRAPTPGPSKTIIDYVRIYQKAGALGLSCMNARESDVDFFPTRI